MDKWLKRNADENSSNEERNAFEGSSNKLSNIFAIANESPKKIPG